MLFTQPFTRTVLFGDGETLIRKTYQYIPLSNETTPWKYFGQLKEGDRVVGLVQVPRHMRPSRQYHALMQWIVNDQPDLEYVGAPWTG